MVNSNPLPFESSGHDHFEGYTRERLKNHFAKKPVCGRWTARLIDDQKHTHLFRLNCKLWNCPRCGPKKAARYKHRIREMAEEMKLRRFLTLTLDPNKVRTTEPVPYLRDCWAKFRIYLERQYGTAPTFICVLEFQKNGYPHLHVLVDRFIPQPWIKETWQRIGGGQHVDIRPVDLHRVSRYLSKYLTKELLLSAPKRCRRVTTSRNLQLNPKRERHHSAELLKVPISAIFDLHRDFATHVLYDEDGVTLQMFICEKLLV